MYNSVDHQVISSLQCINLGQINTNTFIIRILISYCLTFNRARNIRIMYCMSALKSGSATCLSPRQLLGVGALLSPGTRLFGQTFFSLALFFQTSKGITRPSICGLVMFEPSRSWFHYPTLIYTTDVNFFLLHAINNATAVHVATDTDTDTTTLSCITSLQVLPQTYCYFGAKSPLVNTPSLNVD
jgi:hypothetical protein